MQNNHRSYLHVERDESSEDAATEQFKPEDLAELLFDVRAEREQEGTLPTQHRSKAPAPPSTKHTAYTATQDLRSEVLAKFPRPGPRAGGPVEAVSGGSRVLVLSVLLVLATAGTGALLFLL